MIMAMLFNLSQSDSKMRRANIWLAEIGLTTANNVLLCHCDKDESIRKQRSEDACDGTTLCVGVS